MTADVQAGGSFVEFAEHALGEVEVDPVDGFHHLEIICEETGDVFAAGSHGGDFIGRG